MNYEIHVVSLMYNYITSRTALTPKTDTKDDQKDGCQEEDDQKEGGQKEGGQKEGGRKEGGQKEGGQGGQKRKGRNVEAARVDEGGVLFTGCHGVPRGATGCHGGKTRKRRGLAEESGR